MYILILRERGVLRKSNGESRKTCYTPEYLFCKKPDFIFCLISGKCEDDGYYKIGQAKADDKKKDEEQKDNKSKEDFQGVKEENTTAIDSTTSNSRKYFKEIIIDHDSKKRKLKSRKKENKVGQLKIKENTIKSQGGNRENGYLESDRMTDTQQQQVQTNFQQYSEASNHFYPSIRTCYSECFIAQNEFGYHYRWCFTYGGWMYCS